MSDNDLKHKIEILQGCFLLVGLPEEKLLLLADSAQVLQRARGEHVYKQNQPAQSFFIVWSGRIRLITTYGEKKSRRGLAALIYGDYFGEDCLEGRKRLDAAVALEPCELLEIPRQALQDFFKHNPDIGELVRNTAHARHLARKKRYKWLAEDEAIYVVERKSRFFLLISLLLPVFLGFIGLILFALAPDVKFVVFLAGLLLVSAIFLTIWRIVDWENDYYVVTSKRALWFEKVIIFYDSLQEAPLDAVQSTKVIFNPILHRITQYGTVIVNTYTGSILMKRAQDAAMIVAYIELLRVRAGEVAKQEEEKAMERELRERLHIPPPQEEEVEAGESQPEKPITIVTHESLLVVYWRNFLDHLRLRYQKGENIFYRKHWVILVRKTFWPALLSLVIIALAAYLWSVDVARNTFMVAFWFLALLGTGSWWFYNAWDWHDDIFILTLESVIDVDKKPLTREERRVAALDKILSLEHSRLGISGLLLNYGTVVINVGSERLTFDYVKDPVKVQYEINDRMNARRRRREQHEAAKERERIINWLTIYHEVEKLENVENNPSMEDVSG